MVVTSEEIIFCVLNEKRINNFKFLQLISLVTNVMLDNEWVEIIHEIIIEMRKN